MSEKFPKLERTDEPKWLDPSVGVNLWSLPDIFPCVRLLFYLHAAEGQSIPLQDVELHFGWTMPYARNIIRQLRKFGYLEIIRFPNKRIYYRGSNRYQITRRGFDAVQDLLKEATRPIMLEKIEV